MSKLTKAQLAQIMALLDDSDTGDDAPTEDAPTDMIRAVPFPRVRGTGIRYT